MVAQQHPGLRLVRMANILTVAKHRSPRETADVSFRPRFPLLNSSRRHPARISLHERSRHGTMWGRLLSVLTTSGSSQPKGQTQDRAVAMTLLHILDEMIDLLQAIFSYPRVVACASRCYRLEHKISVPVQLKTQCNLSCIDLISSDKCSYASEQDEVTHRANPPRLMGKRQPGPSFFTTPASGHTGEAANSTDTAIGFRVDARTDHGAVKLLGRSSI